MNSDIELASYSYPFKRIKVFFPTFKELFYVSVERFPFNEYERIFYIYFTMLQILAHELEHAAQFKKLDVSTSKQDIEYLLLRSCYRQYSAIKPDIVTELYKSGFTDSQIETYLKQKHQLYMDNYEFAPHERMAECKSHTNVISIIELVKDSCPTLLTLEQYKLFNNYMRGYKTCASPTKDYLSIIGDSKTWFNVQELGSNFNLINRLLYGLNISGDEYYMVTEYTQHLCSMLF